MIKSLIDAIFTAIQTSGIAPAGLAPWLPILAEGIRGGPEIWAEIRDSLPDDPTLVELIEAKQKVRKPVNLTDGRFDDYDDNVNPDGEE